METARPFEVLRPPQQTRPLVVASPHSGRRYDSAFLASSRLRLAELRRSEDAHVDALVAGLPELGVPVIQALFPRTYVDANREPLELDAGMFDGPLPAFSNPDSPRVRAGLGVIPRVAANGIAIYGGKLPIGEARRRLHRCYFPYHRALTALLNETRARFGFAILVDCHSMPSQAVARHGGPGPDFVLGDRHGGACMPELTAQADSLLSGMGYTVVRNRPYAGGFTTVRHGRPNDGVHALQIEVNRALYLDEAALRPHDGLRPLAGDLAVLVDALADVSPYARAAE
jgi:N-formylglutamate amidohydrolase